MPRYCIVIGKPGIDPIAVAGPYEDEDAAQAEARNYPTAWVDVLIEPQTLKEARDAHASGRDAATS